MDASGKKDIEGLLPDEVKTTVRAENPGLVDQAVNGTPDERRSAKNDLKRLYLAEFKKRATACADYYGEFYKYTTLINRAMMAEL